MEQGREDLRHPCSTMHIDRAHRDREVCGSTVRDIGSRVAFVIKVNASRGAAKEVRLPV